MIKKYIRDEEGNPYGTVVAIDRNKIGFSLCHPNDSFSKSLGTSIARGRAEDNHSLPETTNSHFDSVLETVEEIEDRAQRYFK